MGPLVSTIPDLKSLVGRQIRATIEFPEIPKSTHGVIIDYYPAPGYEIEMVTIAWMRPQDHLTTCPIWLGQPCPSNTVNAEIKLGMCNPQRDILNRSDQLDETRWLELLEA